MRLTKFEVVAWNGKRGIAENGLGQRVRFSEGDVDPASLAFIADGLPVLLEETQLRVITPENAFVQWLDRQGQIDLANLVVTTVLLTLTIVIF